MSRFRLVIVFLVSTYLGSVADASDWPQFLRDSQHTGDAAEELLSGAWKLVPASWIVRQVCAPVR